MKKFLSLLLLTATLFASCKKENTIAADAESNSLANASIVRMGNVVYTDHGADGSKAIIYKRMDNIYVLKLQDMDFTSPFDTIVYLSDTDKLTSTSLKILSALSLEGDVYYTLPQRIDIAPYKFLIIQTIKESSPTATAKLQ